MSALFENAPVTFGVCLLTLFFSFLYGETGILGIDTDRILNGGEVWRFIFGHLAFTSMSQTVVGLILLYTYRSFERQMGSRKYGGFLFLSWLYCNLLYLIILAISNSAKSSFSPSSGPFFFIFAQLAFFYRYVPKVYQNQYVLAGVSFSEKSGIYLLAAQLLFSNGLESILAGLIALSFGFIYTQNLVRVQSFRLPGFVERFFQTISSALSALLPRAGTPAARPARPATGASGAGTRVAGGDRARFQDQLGDSDFFGNAPENHAQNFQALPEPDEESINTLMALGFDRGAVVQALRSAGNNVDAAANRLLR